MVIILLITLLAALLLPGLSRAKGLARRVACASNQKQLGLAWELYTQDYLGSLVDNCAWVSNYMVFASDCADLGIMLDPTRSRFAGYIKDLAVYQDPGSDCETCTGDTAPNKKVLPRSYALNCWVGWAQGYAWLPQRLALAGKCTVFKKTCDLVAPSPSEAFTFLDVHPDSICAPWFGVFVAPPGKETIWNYPASYHVGRGVCAFADGHVDSHKWDDRRTLGSSLDYHFGPYAHKHLSPNNPDILWLERHATKLEQEP